MSIEAIVALLIAKWHMRPQDIFDLTFFQLNQFLTEVNKAEQSQQPATVTFTGPDAMQQAIAYRESKQRGIRS